MFLLTAAELRILLTTSKALPMTFLTEEIPTITAYIIQQNPLLSPKLAHMEINSPRRDQQ